MQCFTYSYSFLARLLFAFQCLILVAPAHAADPFPSRPITIVVGFPPGSAPDIAARLFSQTLAVSIKQPVVVENRTGAGGQIAARSVARLPGDGYTILFGDVGAIAIAPAAYQGLGYSPLKDFTALHEVVTTPFALVTSATSSFKTFQEFVAAARAPGAQTNMATFGPGTVVHLALEMLASANDFRALSIPYRNTGELLSAVIGGDAQIAYTSFAVAAPQVSASKLRVLGVTSPTRSPMLPEAPTLAELGMPTLSVSGWITAFVPSATPAPIVDTLRAHLEAASKDESLKRQLEAQGFILNRMPGSEVGAYIRTEVARWSEVVKRSGFRGN